MTHRLAMNTLRAVPQVHSGQVVVGWSRSWLAPTSHGWVGRQRDMPVWFGLGRELMQAEGVFVWVCVGASLVHM